jgi:hypothetical protein
MKPWIRSVVAIVVGFLTTAVASTVTDAIMNATGIFPNSPRSIPICCSSSLRPIERSSPPVEVS